MTTSQDVAEFSQAMDRVADLSRVQRVHRCPAAQFPRLHVSTNDGRRLDIDFEVDWRRDDPVQLGSTRC